MVDWLVSITIRSGQRCAECSRMIDLSNGWLREDPDSPSGGQYQFVTSINARRELPTKRKYRAKGTC